MEGKQKAMLKNISLLPVEFERGRRMAQIQNRTFSGFLRNLINVNWEQYQKQQDAKVLPK